MNTHQLQVQPILYHFVKDMLLTGTGISNDQFWESLHDILTLLTPENKALLHTRDQLQTSIDQWHQENPKFEMVKYKQFLTDIGYLEPVPTDFTINVSNTDPEISSIAGPQLVVPVDNARYAINAVNARWGSLYDALYGTDMIPFSGKPSTTYDPERGQKVFSESYQFLDNAIPLEINGHAEVIGFHIQKNNDEAELVIHTTEGNARLKDPTQWLGYTENDRLETLVFVNHGLHIVLHLDKDDRVGSVHPANIKDIQIESALTTILDLEDSVAAVNAQDKVNCYHNLLGLVQGSLTTTLQKNGKTVTRSLSKNQTYTKKSGGTESLSGQSIRLIRNVGHHMMSDAVCTQDGKPIPEGILDAVISGIIALHQQKNTSGQQGFYIVKPKMHGSAEVAFSVALFTAVEAAFGLAHNTLKMGIMDEERRTSVNLKACIHAAKERVIFINTGFLDRTGDEIHTNMYAGAVLPKEAIKQEPWLMAYETANVKHGLDSGFSGQAQIGKGMWPIPDKMRAMFDSKMAHLQAGANCAWVPSPTAATLHALHYHQLDVLAHQKTLQLDPNLDDILTAPTMSKEEALALSKASIQQELDNNIQGILGYVVRWVDAGIGCSKVPDIHDVGLMEDRATLRISSQHVGNWLHHQICDNAQVEETLLRMAKVVDQQNQQTAGYQTLTPTSPAFLAARALVFEAIDQPNGYTEFILTKFRKQITG